jgi:hypothetical protein
VVVDVSTGFSVGVVIVGLFSVAVSSLDVTSNVVNTVGLSLSDVAFAVGSFFVVILSLLLVDTLSAVEVMSLLSVGFWVVFEKRV